MNFLKLNNGIRSFFIGIRKLSWHWNATQYQYLCLCTQKLPLFLLFFSQRLSVHCTFLAQTYSWLRKSVTKVAHHLVWWQLTMRASTFFTRKHRLEIPAKLFSSIILTKLLIYECVTSVTGIFTSASFVVVSLNNSSGGGAILAHFQSQERKSASGRDQLRQPSSS